MIFVNEDAGYEAGQKPAGHVKLEIREGRGRLHAAVQNLRPGNGRFVYKLYLLRIGRDGAAAVCAGLLKPEPSKAELDWSFEPRNVGASGSSLEEFSSVVVLVEYADRKGETIICPLAAYMDKKTEWRNAVRSVLMEKAEMVSYNKIAGVSAEPLAPVNFNSSNKNEVSKLEGTDQNNNTEEYSEPLNSMEPYDDNEYQAIGYADAEWQVPQPIQAEFPQQYPLEYPHQAQQQMPLFQAPQNIPQMPFYIPQLPSEPQMQPQQQVNPQQQPQQQVNPQQQPQPQMPSEPQMQPQPQVNPQQQPLQDQTDVQYPGGIGQIDSGCIYLNGNLCGAFVNSGANAINPCDTCRMHHGQVPAATPPAGDITRLKEELERCFEESDPFNSKRSDYVWWRVTNPVNLNNLLYQCNIRSPLLFNPAVMMAHYKYRHLIIGIFLHRSKQKQYVVCGVPGMHMMDRKPFGEMGRWVQAEGNKPRYGAFGYWLAYIDPNDGKIQTLSQEQCENK